MNHDILAASVTPLVGGVIGFLYIFIFSVVIICLIRMSKYFSTAGKEQKLIRMEIGKLAEEVHQLRQELQEHK